MKDFVHVFDERGRRLVEGAALDPSTSAPWWTEQAQKRRAGQATLRADAITPGRTGSQFDAVAPPGELPTLVVVRADKGASYGVVRGLLTAAQEAGFARFSLIVLKGATP